MNTFHCTHCQSLVFFENTQCLNCGEALAYLPDRGQMASVRPESDLLWNAEISPDNSLPYRLCSNYTEHNVCNWAVPLTDTNPLCQSCRLTRTIPTLTASGKAAWSRLESAKRRLVHNLLAMSLPVARKEERFADGVIFEFLADSTLPNGDRQRVLTGHDNGLITINIAEADDVQRERQRVLQHEPYRTVLGHLRHEIGHYYWDRLIQNSEHLEGFRSLFGDERADYGESLELYYKQGPSPGWEERYISAYATAHPWEDWAESWAHFLHMYDALETAIVAGLYLQPERDDEPAIAPLTDPKPLVEVDFDNMIERWLPLAYVMNNLSRGLGHPDSYPFVLTTTVIGKLRFIHGVVGASRATSEDAGTVHPDG
jgi:hypothetical protein